MFSSSTLFASEAGAIFLLISPGARAGGMGEAQVAVANDAYASYWNPAGLAFLEGSELALMHVNWLRNLADDLYYEFLAYRKSFPNLGTLGGHIIYLSLGEQIRMDEYAQYQGKFTSYMVAGAVSYSALLSRTSSLGLNAKVSYQHLVEMGTGSEKGKGTSMDFGFDIGYMKKEFLTPRLDIGLNLSNIGPKISFIDPDQADPQPTNLTIGFNYALIQSQHNNLNIVYDVDKMLVASYPDMDWNGDGAIGGFDEDGHVSLSGDYSSDGKIEIAHTDPIYLALFTSWVDDWLLGGDMDRAISGEEPDRKIGGYSWDESLDDGNGIPDKDEMINSTESGAKYGDADWGIYNEWGQKEVGSGDDRTISNELDKLVHNVGVEYWYSTYFALRAGYYYDKTGKIDNPTFGVGLRFGGYGFDFGYTSGEPGHPLTNTMRFSLNMLF
ncbi:MAG: PorV/PorQ family protein [Candidatus Marinimicrobia bacterium]|nr:PorV/PorQ family protein [Candidatus Neomarinimicrobiota bacterium]MBT3618114.1 PorV/PorQ family protein [Candidatus Neomarinimicrobiota bacterium]MBT3828585.1 PorV/PorQ family protein [Candidatus Neomarinimicrobiota bacterium]MBT3996953.1 PorV/PorQ family protein [Candidatus Neomarinimicrobiota bacterium]MBT4280917.1 PorV/PorQ family protein [Candidatus Neomarinimicrobiota bacterium]